MQDLEHRLDQLTAKESLALIADLFPGKVVFSTSLGQEDQVITQLIASQNLPIQ
ncbi:MAG TPA: phosphoadenylyl-sulfate reductase, partial [Algoriphagus sp.]|nr:phosphoadenylyl-sulfate reductase [Algoriphagus sp.]